MKKISNNEVNFEESLNRLEKIVNILQDGNLTLDESLDIFKEGVELVKVCQNKLDNAETKINLLLKDNNGKGKEVPFELESDNNHGF